eukprot:CAMPEP_0194154694 /NCGR_PEP_ID=MMETSP0152-20130528/61534_1 /TAXON_ID=1049557 /ORGANISM="Thalassiothrix antarctica, Strain L6-D1" /LENGTH=544 /DNA_ID=CAMNT_0038860957 /DNA_START=149 /DNA_END=1786 /DNA_ORIENTATION=+
MTSSFKLPAGSLGIVFKGSNPPVVKEVKYESELFGKVKCGFSFLSVNIDGREQAPSDAVSLAKSLKETSNNPNRIMNFTMTLPAEIEFILPEGDVGLSVTDVDGIAIITKISAESPLKHIVRIGMAVDSFTLPDGSTMTGGSSAKVSEWLRFNQTAGRVMILKDPSLGDLSPPSYSQANVTVDLPLGNIDDLGLIIQGNDIATLEGVNRFSHMHGKVPANMIIGALRIPDGREFQGLNQSFLAKVLQETQDVEGRILYLMNPGDGELPSEPVLKAFLPVLGNCSELGLVLGGNPARVRFVNQASEMNEIIKKGMEVVKVGWKYEPDNQDISAEAVTESLTESSGTDRYILFRNIYKAIPDEVEVNFAPGRIGIIFGDNPPRVKGFTQGCTVSHLIDVGMVADTLILDSGKRYTNLETHKLTRTLIANAGSNRRVIRFINPATVELSTEDDLERPDMINLNLPTGKLHISLKGPYPPRVSNIKPISPLLRLLPKNMAVDELIIDGRSYSGFNSIKLATLLKETEYKQGRVMKLKNPYNPNVSFHF